VCCPWSTTAHRLLFGYRSDVAIYRIAKQYSDDISVDYKQLGFNVPLHITGSGVVMPERTRTPNAVPVNILGLERRSGSYTATKAERCCCSGPGNICPKLIKARIHGCVTVTKTLVLICLYFLKCTKFDQLILGKIIKMVATRCQILRLKCTKSISAGALPQTPLEELTVLVTVLPQTPS